MKDFTTAVMFHICYKTVILKLNISFQANKIFQPPMIDKFTVTTTNPHAAEHTRCFAACWL